MIQSLQNKLIKTVSQLKTAKGRKSEGLYLLEGIKPVAESIELGLSLEIIICSEICNRNQLPQHSVVTEVTEKVFKHLTTLENPEGVISINRMNRLNITAIKKKPFLVLCGVQDPGNTGTLIRSADAFGFSQVVFLEGNADPFSPKATRASMGSILRIEAYFGETNELLSLVRSGDCPLIGLDVSSTNEIIAKEGLSDFFGLVVGSESHGIPENILSALTLKIKIPMAKSVESLNAAIAGSIIMQQIFSKRKP